MRELFAHSFVCVSVHCARGASILCRYAGHTLPVQFVLLWTFLWITRHNRPHFLSFVNFPSTMSIWRHIIIALYLSHDHGHRTCVYDGAEHGHGVHILSDGDQCVFWSFGTRIFCFHSLSRKQTKAILHWYARRGIRARHIVHFVHYIISIEFRNTTHKTYSTRAHHATISSHHHIRPLNILDALSRPRGLQ